MKKIILLLLLPTFFLFGQTVDFDDASKWTEGSGALNTFQNDHKYSDQINGYDVEFTGNLIRRKSAGTEDGFPATHNNSNYAWELKEGAATNLTATIYATEISGFSFYARQQDGEPNPVYIVERVSSPSSPVWYVMARLDSANFFGEDSDWRLYTYSGTMTEADSIGKISIKISPWGYLGPVDGIMIDDFSFNNPMPVELTTFTASLTGNNITLNWETATEVNNFGFDIEFSNDKVQWTKLGFVKGSGNTNAPKHYSFTTEYKARYFRLKQIDMDGTFEYSKIVEANVNIPQKFEVKQNYPNPFNPATTISFLLPQKENVKLVIYNSLGEAVKTLVNETLEAGLHKYNFNADNLGSGIYFYQVTAGNNIEMRKMLLMK